jgi:hypothetical protein
VWKVGSCRIGVTSAFFSQTMCQFKFSEVGSSKYFIDVFLNSRRLNNKQ